MRLEIKYYDDSVDFCKYTRYRVVEINCIDLIGTLDEVHVVTRNGNSFDVKKFNIYYLKVDNRVYVNVNKGIDLEDSLHG